MVRTALLAIVATTPALAGATAATAPANAGLSFARVFAAGDERGPMHFKAVYVTDKAEHQLELWREGATRLKRLTDADIETHVTRQRGGAEFDMTVIDRRRKILTRIARTNLYRIGNQTDWFDLAHGLRHPKGDYRLARTDAPPGAPAAVGSCTWYTLTQAGRVAQICWSARHQLPLTILGQDGQVRWRVTELDQRPIAPSVFAVDGRGYVRNDANQDIERD
ncbi:hypothetical protein ACFPOE_19285 [Caenimonas terrae]|uniref:Uncharacterized protein n=1 Tax=Caenimonas terrae TaxID=696074 RepID=A0ABW0NHC3_9BURK